MSHFVQFTLSLILVVLLAQCRAVPLGERASAENAATSTAIDTLGSSRVKRQGGGCGCGCGCGCCCCRPRCCCCCTRCCTCCRTCCTTCCRPCCCCGGGGGGCGCGCGCGGGCGCCGCGGGRKRRALQQLQIRLAQKNVPLALSETIEIPQIPAVPAPEVVPEVAPETATEWPEPVFELVTETAA